MHEFLEPTAYKWTFHPNWETWNITLCKVCPDTQSVLFDGEIPGIDDLLYYCEPDENVEGGIVTDGKQYVFAFYQGNGPAVAAFDEDGFIPLTTDDRALIKIAINDFLEPKWPTMVENPSTSPKS